MVHLTVVQCVIRAALAIALAVNAEGDRGFTLKDQIAGGKTEIGALRHSLEAHATLETGVANGRTA